MRDSAGLKTSDENTGKNSISDATHFFQEILCPAHASESSVRQNTVDTTGFSACSLQQRANQSQGSSFLHIISRDLESLLSLSNRLGIPQSPGYYSCGLAPFGKVLIL